MKGSENILSEITKLQARERNLLIKMAKICVKEKSKIKSSFSIEDINTAFYFRQSDIKSLLNKFFSKKGDKYNINQEKRAIIESIIQKHEESIVKFEASEKDYIEQFSSFRNEYKNNIHGFDFNNEYQKLYSNLEPHLEILHWSILPEYNEQTMINSRMLPENNLKEYYEHYHTLEDLYEALKGTSIPIESLKGDKNLNRKLTFRVFSRRWGHDDCYTVERRIDGWYASHISINGLSKKDGTGALIVNFQHDLIQFPEDGVKYALETLWDMADETEMTVDELQNKLQEIADWISAVEKVVGEYQPDWCGYY